MDRIPDPASASKTADPNSQANGAAGTPPPQANGTPSMLTVLPFNEDAIRSTQAKQMAEWLAKLIAPDQVVELRAIGVGEYRQTHAGFFDGAHLFEMALEATGVTRKAKGAYWTINSLRPEILARRINRIARVSKDEAISACDADVVRRCWLPIDVDARRQPVHDSHVSTTDAEKAEGLKVVLAIRDFLSSQGWPAPMVCDSGNSYHAFYRIDLANDEPSKLMIQRVLKALAAQFTNDFAEVDTSVYNASRIMKLPYTFAKKGDSTKDRPHRRSSVRECPVELIEVPADKLAALAETYTEPEPPRRTTASARTTRSRRRGGASAEDRARAYLAKVDPAVSGESGHDQTYHAAAVLVVRFNMTPDEAYPILAEWNAKCSPPWEEKDLRRKLQQVDENEKGPRGDLLNAERERPRAGVTEEADKKAAEESAKTDESIEAQLARLDEVLAGGDVALFGDEPLLHALAELSFRDAARYATVRARLKAAKISLRSLDKVIKPLAEKARQESRGAALPPYMPQAGQLCAVIEAGDNGPIYRPMCNFTARVVEEITLDDGVEKTRSFEIEGRVAGGEELPRVRVTASAFQEMKWICEAWGSAAAVYGGYREGVRAAVLLASEAPVRRTVHTHTGWRQIGEEWLFLHAGGAIGADGPVADIEVELPEALARYVLPDPPEGETLRRAIQASLKVADIGPDTVTLPLLLATRRVVIGETDLSIDVVGGTGLFKTQLAALAVQQFGPGMDGLHLPANWSSTGNFNEALAFLAKDVLLPIDDFAPGGSEADIQRLHRDADRLARGAANHAGRGRCRPDGSISPARHPRCLILSTGEDQSRNTSILPRKIIVEVTKGDIDPGKLTACQADAAAGLYAQSMSGFIRWLAGRRDDVVKELHDETLKLRDATTSNTRHRRVASNAATMLAGWKIFLRFAQEAEAIGDEQANELFERAETAFQKLAERQDAHHAAADPVKVFARLLSAVIGSGMAHLMDTEGRPPSPPDSFGWTQELRGHGCNERENWHPQGSRIGWIDDDDLYLEPEAAYAAIKKLAAAQGTPFAISQTTLWKRLDEAGLLKSKDDARQTLKVRQMLQDRRESVIHLTSVVIGVMPEPEVGQGFKVRIHGRETA
jgi:hypothetical protein